MISELERQEFEFYLLEIEKDNEEFLKVCNELKILSSELKLLLDSDKRIKKLESIKKIKALRESFSHLSNYALGLDTAIDYEKLLLSLLSQFQYSAIQLKKIPNKSLLVNFFKHINEIFQTIKYGNHIVLLQPRLQAINSVRV
ncbi:hypothetical protein Acal02_03518 [Acinetobacter calcoaceticus]